MKNVPNRIYLNLGEMTESEYQETDFKVLCKTDENAVTWCEDGVFKHDIEFIRKEKVRELYEDSGVYSLINDDYDKIVEFEKFIGVRDGNGKCVPSQKDALLKKYRGLLINMLGTIADSINGMEKGDYDCGEVHTPSFRYEPSFEFDSEDIETIRELAENECEDAAIVFMEWVESAEEKED